MYDEILLYYNKGLYSFTSSSKWKGKSVDELFIATKWLHCFISYHTLYYRNKEKIVPLLDKCSLRGHKLLNYKDFKKAAELIKSKAHLTKKVYWR